VDTTSRLSPAHYGLANQIKSVGLYERVLRFIVKVGCAGGLFLLAAQSVDGYNCGVPPRFNVRSISIDPRERSETERIVGCPVLFPDEAATEWVGWADMVTLMNVLEHVNDPFALLGQLKRILRPGGLLLMCLIIRRFPCAAACAIAGRSWTWANISTTSSRLLWTGFWSERGFHRQDDSLACTKAWNPLPSLLECGRRRAGSCRRQ